MTPAAGLVRTLADTVRLGWSDRRDFLDLTSSHLNLVLLALAVGEPLRATELFRHARDPAAWLRAAAQIVVTSVNPGFCRSRLRAHPRRPHHHLTRRRSSRGRRESAAGVCPSSAVVYTA